MTVEVRTDDAAGRFVPGATFVVGQPDGRGLDPTRERTAGRVGGPGRTGRVSRPGGSGTGPAADLPDVLRLAEARRDRGRWLLRFDGITDRGAAEGLRGVRLFSEVSAEPVVEDEWYVADLAGCAVVGVDGTELGVLVTVERGSGQDRLVVRPKLGGEDVRVPFVAELVPDVDVGHRRVVVDPPGGLFTGYTAGRGESARRASGDEGAGRNGTGDEESAEDGGAVP